MRVSVLIAAAALCLSGVAAAAEPSMILAVYRSDVEVPRIGEPASTRTVKWRFERGKDYAAVAGEDGRRAERWQRDEEGRVWYARVFTAERRIIEYQPADLGLGGVTGAWQQVSSIIDPASLALLKRTSEKKEVLGRAAEVYVGEGDGVHTEVWWLPDERVPAYVARRTRTGASSLKLEQIEKLDPARAQWARPPQQLEGYETLEFSDLGDRQGDPFIEKLMQYEGSWFGHGHSH